MIGEDQEVVNEIAVVNHVVEVGRDGESLGAEVVIEKSLEAEVVIEEDPKEVVLGIVEGLEVVVGTAVGVLQGEEESHHIVVAAVLHDSRVNGVFQELCCLININRKKFQQKK